MMRADGQVALLGDSIFDNKSYTGGNPDVVAHLRTLLPQSWSATLLAVDGTTTADVSRQFTRIPDGATDVVLSLGGNDALMNSDILDKRVRSTADALLLFADRVERFEHAYRHAVGALAAPKRRLTVCTIYNGAMPPEQARAARVALMLFNDVILRTAFEHGAAVIDLRAICCEPSDYANPIEPSGSGGLKIAVAIARAIGAVPDDGPSSTVRVR